jgi:CheY-like chemotaxis protein
MVAHVLVKVLGFSDVERHALNSLLRISQQRSPSFDLWTPAAQTSPTAILIDGKMVQADNEAAQASAQYPHARVLWFGAHPPVQAWQAFNRPIPWVRVLKAMDAAHAVQVHQAQGSDAQGFDVASQDFDDTTPAAQEAEHATSHAKRILIADDDLTCRLYMRAKLASFNLTHVDEASSGQEALQMASQKQYDCIFLDVDMPPGNGFDVCRAIKRQSRIDSKHLAAKAKVILLTSRNGVIDRVRGNLMGADAYVTKPPLPARLSEIILSL